MLPLNGLQHCRLILVQHLRLLELLQFRLVPNLFTIHRRLCLVRLHLVDDRRSLLGQFRRLLLVLLPLLQRILRMLLDLILQLILNLCSFRPLLLMSSQPSRQCRHLQLINPIVIFPLRSDLLLIELLRQLRLSLQERLIIAQ